MNPPISTEDVPDSGRTPPELDLVRSEAMHWSALTNSEKPLGFT
jgi:hypothetical protein